MLYRLPGRAINAYIILYQEWSTFTELVCLTSPLSPGLGLAVPHYVHHCPGDFVGGFCPLAENLAACVGDDLAAFDGFFGPFRWSLMVNVNKKRNGQIQHAIHG